MAKSYFLLFILIIISTFCCGQDGSDISNFKNQVSTNITYLAINSIEINYERTIGRKFAFGLGWAKYGKGYYDLEIESEGFNYATQFEITPFGRLYFNGNRKKSHILEVFASINQSEVRDQFLRNTTDDGFGVYERGTETNTNFGMGVGYGYRFLFLKERLAVEAQLGVRTNFDFFFGIPLSSVVRSGLRVGYRF